MKLPPRPGPYRHADLYIRPSAQWADSILPSRRPGVRPPEELDATSEALARALWPRLHARHPHVPREHLLPACWSLAALGFSLEYPDEALWALELLGRYGDQVSSMEIAEAVKRLGSQADLFLESWVTGLHQATTGTGEFPVALWEFDAFMTLTLDGAERVRRRYEFRLSPPPELVERERRAQAHQNDGVEAARGERGDLSPRNRLSGRRSR